MVDPGETQFSQARLLFPEWTHSREPLIRCDVHGHLYLAWLETLVNYDQAFFSFSADGGQTWSQVLNISRSDWGVHAPDLAVDGAGHFYMAWMAYDGQARGGLLQPLHRQRRHLAPAARVSRKDASAEWPVLAVDERGTVFVAWVQSVAAGGSEVVLASSPDLGATWSQRTFRRTQSPGQLETAARHAPGGAAGALYRQHAEQQLAAQGAFLSGLRTFLE